MPILGFDTKYKQEHSESTELDHSMGRKEGLSGIKLPRIFLRGQREVKWHTSKLISYDSQQGVVFGADAGCLDRPGTRCPSPG